MVEVEEEVDEESVVVASPEPELQAAKAPIAKTNKSFFIVVNVLCVSEFDIDTRLLLSPNRIKITSSE